MSQPAVTSIRAPATTTDGSMSTCLPRRWNTVKAAKPSAAPKASTVPRRLPVAPLVEVITATPPAAMPIVSQVVLMTGSLISSHASKPASTGAAPRMRVTSATVATLVDLPFIFLFIAVVWFVGGPVAIIPLFAVVLVFIVGLIVQVPLRALVR